mmetsp:Transcript_3838/g.14559  ORF Transcript_3838/g.14559 Transcript_3838/m.14559 type:complete len:237 (-) Transcript_3838:6840-7550(-)
MPRQSSCCASCTQPCLSSRALNSKTLAAPTRAKSSFSNAIIPNPTINTGSKLWPKSTTNALHWSTWTITACASLRGENSCGPIKHSELPSSWRMRMSCLAPSSTTGLCSPSNRRGQWPGSLHETTSICLDSCTSAECHNQRTSFPDPQKTCSGGPRCWPSWWQMPQMSRCISFFFSHSRSCTLLSRSTTTSMLSMSSTSHSTRTRSCSCNPQKTCPGFCCPTRTQTSRQTCAGCST